MSPLSRFALSARLAPRALVPVSSLVRPLQAYTANRHFHLSKMAGKQIATLDVRRLTTYPINRH
jgi:cyanate lyase